MTRRGDINVIWRNLGHIRDMAAATELPFRVWVVHGGRPGALCVPEEQTIFRWVPVIDWSGLYRDPLQEAIAKTDALLAELGHPLRGALYEKRRDIARQFAAAGISDSVLVAGVHFSVLVQLEARLKRKDLNAMVSRVATEACDEFAVYDESARHLNKRMARKPIDGDFAERMREAVERDRLAGKPDPVAWLRQRLRDVYAEDNRLPFHQTPPADSGIPPDWNEQMDMRYLTAAFWSNGRPRAIVRPAKRPRHVFWQVYAADIVDSYTTREEIMPSVAIRLTSALLLTTLVESGAFPPSFNKTFSVTAIKKSLQRKPPREIPTPKS